MLKIRNVELSDLSAVVAIENLCFSKEEKINNIELLTIVYTQIKVLV